MIGDQEGIDLLLAAVKHLVFEMGRKDIQFVLVGDGPSRKRMEALSVEMGLADYVTFLAGRRMRSCSRSCRRPMSV